MKWAAKHPRETLQTIQIMFPDTSATELTSIRKYYLPQLKKRIAQLEATIDSFTPYSNGSPGIANGAATIQLYLGVIGIDRWHDEQVAFASIPELGGLRWRRSILSDGVYAPPGWEHFGPLGDEAQSEAHRQGMAGVVSPVTIGTLGVTPEAAVSNRGRMASFPNQLVEQARMGTDATRWQMVSDHLVKYFRETVLTKIIDVRRGGGYVALPLTGLWATAPYLHNGSMPTLWHLMHPGERPARFQVGGHRLDRERMGIDGEIDACGVYAYPAGYAPWSLPEVYDTTSPGRGNGGHERRSRG